MCHMNRTYGSAINSIIIVFSLRFDAMARGHQKAQSQERNKAKQAALKKTGHNANQQKKAAMKALTFQCPICRVSIILVVYMFFYIF